MAWLFLICATIGGTILVCQFVLALVGFGADVDIADDVPDDVPHDFHTGGSHGGHDPDPELGDHGVGHGNFSTWLFGMLSFKTITAALAFFGFAGCAAESAGMSTMAQLVIATAAGMAALYGVHSIMQLLFKLSQDNTIRLHNAVGKEGTVYLTIPAHRKNTGKVQFKLQNRLVDYPALTDHDEPLPTGAKIRIVAVEGTTLQVEPYVELKSLAAEVAQAN
jgi:membrane protein implicated in regulation of membrane protease activity